MCPTADMSGALHCHAPLVQVHVVDAEKQLSPAAVQLVPCATIAGQSAVSSQPEMLPTPIESSDASSSFVIIRMRRPIARRQVPVPVGKPSSGLSSGPQCSVGNPPSALAHAHVCCCAG